MAFEDPFILYDNVLETYGISSITSEASGFPKENLYDGKDWTYWKGTLGDSTNNIDIDKGAAGIEVDTLAILNHNFFSIAPISANVSVYESDNSSFSPFTVLGSKTITSDNPFYINLDSGTKRYNRIHISISSGTAPVFSGVVFLGKKMTIPVGPEFSFDPDKQNIKSEKYLSYSGKVITSNVRFSERTMDVSFKRIPQSFIISDVLTFLEDHYGEMKSFFFVPDPGNVWGTGKVYFLIAPNDPMIELPTYNDDVGYRNWTLKAVGFRQSTFR